MAAPSSAPLPPPASAPMPAPASAPPPAPYAAPLPVFVAHPAPDSSARIGSTAGPIVIVVVIRVRLVGAMSPPQKRHLRLGGRDPVSHRITLGCTIAQVPRC